MGGAKVKQRRRVRIVASGADPTSDYNRAHATDHHVRSAAETEGLGSQRAQNATKERVSRTRWRQCWGACTQIPALLLGKKTQLPICHGVVCGFKAAPTLADSAIAVSCVLGNLHPLIRP
jgi:hypothetical protein